MLSSSVGHAHVVEIVVFAAGDLVVGVVRLPLPVEREQHVVGVEIARRLEVLVGLPLDALAQMEGDRLAAVGDVPALREARDDLGGAALELGQAVVDRPLGVEAGAGGVDRRLEILRRCLPSNRPGFWPAPRRPARRSSPSANQNDRFMRLPLRKPDPRGSKARFPRPCNRRSGGAAPLAARGLAAGFLAAGRLLRRPPSSAPRPSWPGPAARAGLAGRPSRSAINSTASASVIVSGDIDFGMVAFTLPHLT